MSNPFFSIVTPVFNGSDHICDYFDTLLSQSFTNWEAIIVDDSSTDDSLEILKIYKSSDPRFKVFSAQLSKSVPGPYAARNYALRRCQGLYICFLDVDDVWAPDKLKRQFDLISLFNYQLLYSSYYRFHPADSSKCLILRVPFQVLPLTFLLKFVNPIPMLTSCCRASVLVGHEFSAVNHEDHLFWKNIICELDQSSIYFDHNPLAYYRIHNASITSSKLLSFQWSFRLYRCMGCSFLDSLFRICFKFVYSCLVLFLQKRIKSVSTFPF